MISAELLKYLEKIVKIELKWMYHYEIDDDMFGIETDKYTWCKNVINGRANIDNLLQYFKKYYASDEKVFIKNIQELM